MGLTVCAAVFLVADWRRLPRRLLEAVPWLLAATVAVGLDWLELRRSFGNTFRALESRATPELRQLFEAYPGIMLQRAATAMALVAGLACAGLEACRRLGRRGLPWSRVLLGERDPSGPGAVRWLGETSTVVAGGVAWSCLVFQLFDPASDVLASMGSHRSGLAYASTWLAVPITEELSWRLGIQGVLQRILRARWALPVSIVATSVLWSLASASEPVGIVQLVPVGLALGWLQVRHGTEACIAAHVGFTAAMLWLAPILWPA